VNASLARIDAEIAALEEAMIDDEERELCALSLGTFARLAWPMLEPATPLKWGWALDAICDHLEAVTRGDIKRLLMNVPPGSMKSLLTGVIWPAWEWGPRGKPELRFLGTAHKQDLAVRDNLKCRRLIKSAWYQHLWPVTITGDQDAKTKFENDKTGFREAMAFTSLTGSRGDRVILDDPHSVDDANSQTKLAGDIVTFREAVPSRVNNDDSAIIIVMQRLHESDVSSVALELGYEHLCIPMRFEEDRRCTTSIGWADPRTIEGDLMFPERFPERQVVELETSLGSYAAAGQLQQRPAPLGGGIFKTGWWQYYRAEALPQVKRIIHSWDTAFKTKASNDYSVRTIWAECERGYYLLDVWKQKVEFPELKRMVLSFPDQHKPHAILVEDKASGQSLIQELRRETMLPIVPIKVDTDKVARAFAVTPVIESGRVFLPEGAPWLADYIASLATFPNGAHDDDVDSTTQALAYLSRGGGSTGFLDWIAGEHRRVIGEETGA
jgi:predicted phage terminase large subunit-like protein